MGLFACETSHYEDLVGRHEGVELTGFLDRGDGKTGRATAQGCLGGAQRAVAVAARLDDRNQARAFRQVREDASAVGAYRAQVDIGPTQRK
jgi:hypothetical protein